MRRNTHGKIQVVPMVAPLLFSVLLFVVFLAGSGCTLLSSGTGRTHIRPEILDELSIRPLQLEIVSIDMLFGSARIEANARFILELYLEHANLDDAVDPNLEPIQLRYLISEQRIVENYIVRNAISIEVLGFTGAADRPVIRSFYSIDHNSSIVSYSFLQKVLNDSLKTFLPRSRRL